MDVFPLDLVAEREEVGEAVDEAVLRVLASGRYVLGPEVERFERDFAELCRVPHAVAVASGTEALILGLRALGIGPGDKVLTSPFTFFASAGAIAWIGARPIFADVDPETALLDPRKVEAALTPDTKAILPVHLYGQMADMRALREQADAHDLRLLEDGAQAHGAMRDDASCGELGDACTFSFYPTKNLGAAGEAGLVVTREAEVAARLRELRDHGSREKYVHESIGTNGRMHAIQGAVLNAKLPRLAAWNARRAELAALYDAAFADSTSVLPLAVVPGAKHVYHQYTVRLAEGLDRAKVLAGLAERGIHAAVHYPRPVHLQPAARAFDPAPGSYPVAEALAERVLCLPIHPYLDAARVERVAGALLALASA